MGNCCFSWTCDRDFRGLLLIPQGSQASFQVVRRSGELLLRHCSGKGPHLALRAGSRGVSRVAMGNLGFLSSNLLCCLREVKSTFELWEEHGIALELLQGNRVSSRIDRGILWCFSSCSGKHWISLELQLGPQETSHVASGKSALLSSFKEQLGILLESMKGYRASSWVEAGYSGFLSSCYRDLGLLSSFHRGVWPHLLLRHGNPLSSRVVKVVSHFLSSSGGEPGLFLDVQQGSQTSIHVVRGY